MSELSYILDSDALVKFLSYFEGMTITIPSLKDLRRLLQAFTLYRLVVFEGIDMNAAVKELDTTEFTKDEIKQMYVKILDVVKDYDFGI